MMCGQSKDLMAAAWQGELDRAAELEFRKHLESCAECGTEMNQLGGLWQRLGDLPVPEPSRDLDRRWRNTLVSLTAPVQPKRSLATLLANFWPQSPVWQAAIAMACLVVGLVAGAAWAPGILPRHSSEIAQLHEEIASTRAMVALSLLQQQSATERLRGVDYTGRMKTLDPPVVSALVDAVSRDPNVNVRLAAIDALSKVAAEPAVLEQLARTLPQQESPMVQATLVDFFVDAHDRQAVGPLRQLASQPDLNPAVLERTRFALDKLSR